MFAFIVAASIGILFSAFCLWAGMKLTKVQGSFLMMLVIAIVAGVLGLIPAFGWILGTVAMFILICKWTGASFWPDAVLMVVVARLVGIFGGIFIAGLLGGL